jgi:thiopeptide-type bacteriocin biosynthesis protein
MAEREWVSAHVFYSDDLDRLLDDAIRPLVGELVTSGLVRGWFFLRYWDGGPHVRLRLLPAHAGTHDAVRDAVLDHGERYLRRCPSRTPVAAADYAALAGRLARWERLSSYAATPFPNNSVQFIAYRPEHDRYGTGRRLHAVERHFDDSSRIALALVSADVSAAARETVAFCAATLAWYLCPSRPFRSPESPGLADRYASQRDRLRGLVVTMRALAAGRPDAGSAGSAGGLRAWRDSVVALRDALAAHPSSVPAAAVVDTCVHLFCNRLGVSLPEENYIRYLALRATADHDGRE